MYSLVNKDYFFHIMNPSQILRIRMSSLPTNFESILLSNSYRNKCLNTYFKRSLLLYVHFGMRKAYTSSSWTAVCKIKWSPKQRCYPCFIRIFSMPLCFSLKCVFILPTWNVMLVTTHVMCTSV